MATLFGTPPRALSKNLVEFRAGKMTMRGKTVTADKRKGLVYIHQSDDGLMHFCWKDRKTSTVEDDLIIFPDDVEYKRVPQCTTGRVYVMKFKSSSRRSFFWMQEPKLDKDDDLCSKVNETLNNPPTPTSGRSNVSTPSGLPSDLSSLVAGESDLQNLLSGMSQQQLISLLSGGAGGGAGLSGLLGNRRGGSRTRYNTSSSSGAPPMLAPSSTTVSTRSAAGAGAGGSNSNSSTPSSIRISDLRSILSNMNVPPAAAAAAGGTPAGGVRQQATASSTASTGVDLSSAMTAEALQPILADERFLQQLQQFLPSIGNSQQLPSAEQMRGTLQSPQFQQALSLFSSALQSGQLAPLIEQFELGDAAVVAAAAGNMEDFVRALQDNQQQQQKQQPDKGSEDKPQ